VTREAVPAAGAPAGVAAGHPVHATPEEAGRNRRGYLVEGLGGAPFAQPGAIDRLRAVREAPAPGERGTCLLAAADPANPYGAALAWPRRGADDRRVLARAAGAAVVLVDGLAAVYVDRGGRSIQTLPPFDDPEIAAVALAALSGLLATGPASAADGRLRELVITKVDGEPVASSPVRDALLAAGYSAGYRGLVLRGPERPRSRA
jgi:ATP-dependent Lhr-like helicase